MRFESFGGVGGVFFVVGGVLRGFFGVFCFGWGVCVLVVGGRFLWGGRGGWWGGFFLCFSRGVGLAVGVRWSPFFGGGGGWGFFLGLFLGWGGGCVL